MKKYFAVYMILAAMLLAGFLFYAGVPKMVPKHEIDFVAINEITRQAELFWRDPDLLNRSALAYRFVVIDNDGGVRYKSGDDMPESLPTAVRRGFLPMDITVDGSVVGKVLVETSPVNAVEQERDTLAKAGLSIFILLCALNFIFLYALHSVLVKPFKRLEVFAHKITTGRLDEPLPMDKNNIFGLFTQSFDVMRASLLEERQNRLKAERAKKELIASLSHDIKTPVTSIRLISELLQAGASDDAVLEKLKTIEMKADQINRLMNDMLHSSLEELGELKVNPVSCESGILNDLFFAADHLSKIRVGSIPACLIELDAARMEQVIGNIITNSYKYAGTDIDVDFKICGEFLQIDINDYGNGVEPEALELITAKFYRGENAKALQKDGEGLGLYIAKLLMEKMDGGLEAHNRSNGFTVRLLLRLSR